MEVDFGSVTAIETTSVGFEVRNTSKKLAGKVVSRITDYERVIKVESQAQVLQEFLKLLEEFRSDKNKFELRFKAIKHSKNGSISKVYVAWAEREEMS